MFYIPLLCRIIYKLIILLLRQDFAPPPDLDLGSVLVAIFSFPAAENALVHYQGTPFCTHSI